jgi:hypothetical protein
MIRQVTLALLAMSFGAMAAGAYANAPSRSPVPEARPGPVLPVSSVSVAVEATQTLPLAAASAPPLRQGTAVPLSPQGREPRAPASTRGLAEGIARAIATPAEAATAGLARPALPDTLRPAPRPAGAALVPAVASRAPAPASQLAVARSPLPERRQETARQRYLQNLQRASAVRTQPVPPAVTGQASGQLCGVNGLQGQTIAPIARTAQGCGVANPVRVTAVDGVRLSTPAVMECDTARALHTWVTRGVKPAVGNHGGGVVELRVAAHYVCRTRNHRAGAPISEHGRGRAIDISAVHLRNGEVFTVLRHWRDATYGPMLRAMHRAACGPFTTTLGPGSDGMHEDHFHFDTAVRRTRTPICR